MRLGKNEHAILRRLIPGAFVPPSVYLDGKTGCPSGNQTLNRLVYEKKLAAFQCDTLTDAERLARHHEHRTTHEVIEFNAALRLTDAGEAALKALEGK